MLKMSRFACLMVAAQSLALAGCGGEEPAAAAKIPQVRHIYTSAVDCEAAGVYSLDNCSTAIASAVKTHEKIAPTFKSLRSCEAKQGAGKCERISDKDFRPRLVAFVFEGKETPAAKPLYPAKGGFRTSEDAVLLATNENLQFTKSARDASEIHGKGAGGAPKAAASPF